MEMKSLCDRSKIEVVFLVTNPLELTFTQLVRSEDKFDRKNIYSSRMTYIELYSPFAGPEYGTMEAAWKAVLVEADRRVTVHNKVKEDLNLGVNNKLKQWQKDNYHKVSCTRGEKERFLFIDVFHFLAK